MDNQDLYIVYPDAEDDKALEIDFEIPPYTKLPKFAKHQNIMQAATYQRNHHLFVKKDFCRHPIIEKESKWKQYWPGLLYIMAKL